MEPQSTLSGFSVQTNRELCFLSDRKYSVRQKLILPSLTSQGFSSKVGNTKDETLCYKQKIIKHSIFNHFTYIYILILQVKDYYQTFSLNFHLSFYPYRDILLFFQLFKKLSISYLNSYQFFFLEHYPALQI